jgi:hypothetical protein
MIFIFYYYHRLNYQNKIKNIAERNPSPIYGKPKVLHLITEGNNFKATTQII